MLKCIFHFILCFSYLITQDEMQISRMPIPADDANSEMSVDTNPSDTKSDLETTTKANGDSHKKLNGSVVDDSKETDEASEVVDKKEETNLENKTESSESIDDEPLKNGASKEQESEENVEEIIKEEIATVESDTPNHGDKSEDNDVLKDNENKDKGEKYKSEQDIGEQDIGEQDKGEQDKGEKDKVENDEGEKDEGEKVKGEKYEGEKVKGEKDEDKEEKPMEIDESEDHQNESVTIKKEHENVKESEVTEHVEIQETETLRNGDANHSDEVIKNVEEEIIPVNGEIKLGDEEKSSKSEKICQKVPEEEDMSSEMSTDTLSPKQV